VKRRQKYSEGAAPVDVASGPRRYVVALIDGMPFTKRSSIKLIAVCPGTDSMPQSLRDDGESVSRAATHLAPPPTPRQVLSPSRRSPEDREDDFQSCNSEDEGEGPRYAPEIARVSPVTLSSDFLGRQRLKNNQPLLLLRANIQVLLRVLRVYPTSSIFE